MSADAISIPSMNEVLNFDNMTPEQLTAFKNILAQSEEVKATELKARYNELTSQQKELGKCVFTSQCFIQMSISHNRGQV